MASPSNQIDHTSWVDATTLIAPVRQLLGDVVSSIHHWTIARSVAGGGDELGVWLVEGTAVGSGGEQPWTIFLKGWSAPETVIDPADWNWPRRETLIYRSGTLADLPGGLTAPRFLGETNRADGSHWLWLEGIPDDDSAWSLTRYGQVARQLGQMNGAFLTDRALPDYPWLSRGWLRQWVEIAGSAVRDLERHADHPIVQQALPPPVAATLGQVWNQRHALLGLLGQLPQTFCHLDAYKRNLFFRKRPDGTDEVVAIDWGYAGIAALGEEIAALVAATLFFGEIPSEGAAELQQTVLAGYMEGLHDAGRSGSPEQVLMGYVASVALRYGVGTLRGQVFYFLDPQNHPRMERMMGMPMDDIIVLFRTLNAWVAELGEEALRSL
ncbi:hypothetical protein BH24CHL2_BH24CHL2_4930 [soil metagenome]|jgi:hypothetical protein